MPQVVPRVVPERPKPPITAQVPVAASLVLSKNTDNTESNTDDDIDDSGTPAAAIEKAAAVVAVTAIKKADVAAEKSSI